MSLHVIQLNIARACPEQRHPRILICEMKFSKPGSVSMERAFDILANLPDDMFPNGRGDTPPQNRKELPLSTVSAETPGSSPDLASDCES